MLKIFHNMNSLDFGALMEVYAETNRISGQTCYAKLPHSEQLLCAEQDFYAYLHDCFFCQRGAFYAVWIAEGAYVSALRIEPYTDGLLLAGLETAPNARRRGYASALIKAVLAYLRDKPCIRLYSHVAKNNAASLAAHKSCGFQLVSDHASLIDGSVLRSACTVCYSFR